MIKYKVSFEITNRVGDSLITDKNLDNELFKQKLKEYQKKYKEHVEQAISQGTDKIKVTNFKIEEVVGND